MISEEQLKSNKEKMFPSFRSFWTGIVTDKHLLYGLCYGIPLNTF